MPRKSAETTDYSRSKLLSPKPKRIMIFSFCADIPKFCIPHFLSESLQIMDDTGSGVPFQSFATGRRRTTSLGLYEACLMVIKTRRKPKNLCHPKCLLRDHLQLGTKQTLRKRTKLTVRRDLLSSYNMKHSTEV